MGVAASCPKQPGQRNRTDNGCMEMLPNGSFHLNFVGRPKKPKPPISPYFKSRQDGAGEKQHKDFIAFMLPGKKCPPKKISVMGEWVPISDDLLYVNKMGISQLVLLTSHRGDETPAGTYYSSI